MLLWLYVDIFGLAISAGTLGLLLTAGRTAFVELLTLVFNLAFLGFAWGIYKLAGG